VSTQFHVNVMTLVKSWAQSQTLNFTEQLELAGVRYLDIRLGLFQREWRLHHSVVVGERIDHLLAAVGAFAATHPQELLVVDITHVFTDNSLSPAEQQASYAALAARIVAQLGRFLVPPPHAPDGLLPGRTMLGAGQRLVVTFDNLFNETSGFEHFWPTDLIYNTYADSPSLADLRTYASAVLIDFDDVRRDFRQNDTLFKMSWTLTEDTKTVIAGLLHLGPGSLFALAAEANAQLADWACNNELSPYPTFTNVVVADNVGEGVPLIAAVLPRGSRGGLPCGK